MPTARPNLFWPLLLIGLGALLLLQTLGLLPASLWAALVQLWPVLLVLVGLDLLIGRRSARGAAAVVVVGVVLVAAALTCASVRASLLPPGGAETLIQTTDGAVRLNAHIQFHAGRLNLSALGPSDHLLEGTARNGPGEAVWQSYSVSGGEGRLVLQQRLDPMLAPFLARRIPSAQWDVRLAQKWPVSLAVDTGDGAATLNFNQLELTRLDLTSGLGETLITFAPGQAAQARLRTGLGAVTLNLPPGFPLRLLVHSGLAQVSLPPSLVRDGEYYTTAGFDASRPFLDLELSAGMGRVIVK